MSLVMHEEDDEDRLIIRTKIVAENSYTEQESELCGNLSGTWCSADNFVCRHHHHLD